MKTSELRSKFLEFFKLNGHTIVESASLVPHNDPTLLFTNAGMNQFKDAFLGKDIRPYKRAVSCQKCVRAGGKHNDLENVGFTARHHTFFEMLGNFSFGDYFKHDAIRLGWKFVTEVLKIPKDKLYVTVYEKDDEAAKIWETQEKIPKERIYRKGEKDNFWAMGDTGPCGPCSEIFVDRGEKYGCNKPDCDVGCDCDRYMEIWNLVFMQFDRSTTGELKPLPKPSVDTGMGLERVASVLQKVETNYDTDTFQDIIAKTSQLAKVAYDPKQKSAFAFRVIADHARASAFLIADGIVPSNEGRGYVLRRIIRRAIRYGRELGFNEPFLNQVCRFVIAQMHDAYPYLDKQEDSIVKWVRAEEEQFFKTLDTGLALLDEELTKLKKGASLSGEVAFKLYDTFGFPLDLTRVICNERNLKIDERGFEEAMDSQKDRSRKSWKGDKEQTENVDYHAVYEKLKAAKKLPQYVGYETLESTSECVAISVPSGDVIEAVFKMTPFYAESGGQVGDKGKVEGDGFLADVIDVQKPIHDLVVAKLKVKKGKLEVGKSYKQSVNEELRRLTERNHTATHLLHWALREVLGNHVKQAGSLVTPDLLRFDFNHFQAMTPEEMQKIEDVINEKIWLTHDVSKQEMEKDAALQAGAIAFFGEKYGDRVRVVSVGDYSVELCGGTHVGNSSEINLFKIASEGGIAAGVRRIIAHTSKSAFMYLRERDQEARLVKTRLKAVNKEEIEQRLDKLALTEKELRTKLEAFQGESVGLEVDRLLKSAKTVNGSSFIASLAQPDPQGMKRLQDISERIRQKTPNVVLVLGMENKDDNKAFLLAAVGKGVGKNLNANAIIQAIAPHIEGKGGGKPEQAQAGGPRLNGLPTALQEAEKLVEKSLL